jgi:hypothetical protein
MLMRGRRDHPLSNHLRGKRLLWSPSYQKREWLPFLILPCGNGLGIMRLLFREPTDPESP